MGYARPVTVDMTDMTCGECGIQFAVPEGWRIEKQNTGRGWHCPNGHARVYLESDEQKAMKALEEEKRRHSSTLARLNEAKAAEHKAQAEMKRMKKRASVGLCPCCNRTFQQLARHMNTKHPDHGE